MDAGCDLPETPLWALADVEGVPMDTCPQCQKPVLDHSFQEAMTCAHAHADEARALIRQALTAAEDTVDGATWTRAADVRSALESMDQTLGFLQEANPALKSDEE